MTKEQFNNLLRNPSTINLNLIKDLEEITDRFPYFQNAHLLLAKQYHGHENIRYESYLRKASAYSPDRTLLYNLIKLEPSDIIHMSVVTEQEIKKSESTEPSFEIDEIKEASGAQHHLSIVEEVVQLDEENIATKTATPIVKGGVIVDEQSTNLSVDPKEIIAQRLRELEQKKSEPILPDESTFIKEESIATKSQPDIAPVIEEQPVEAPKIINLEDQSGIIKTPEKPTTFPAVDQPKQKASEFHSFSEWLQLKSVPVVPESSLSSYPIENTETATDQPAIKHVNEIKKVESQLIEKFIKTEPRIVPSRSEFYSPGNMARLSAKEHEDLISETLARIYAQQGNLRKAIETYRKLSLKIPEKSGYFAALIQELEDKDKKTDL